MRGGLNTLEGDCSADIRLVEVEYWLEFGNRKKWDSYLLRGQKYLESAWTEGKDSVGNI